MLSAKTPRKARSKSPQQKLQAERWLSCQLAPLVSLFLGVVAVAEH